MRTMNMANWTSADIPPRSGRPAVITGATGGLGFETALVLAGAGADVVLTGRKEQKAQTAVAARLWAISEALTNARWPSATMEHAS
ncbi:MULTISPECIES: SDR family NAD(P)-dependent oxidoreductase [unclassified Paraburkholderia]|uniref:SDR family NAD(P)-dependent oxidoreductase n=1 Tax=unclassified Paraburkholderia TaxID=2615204 RepID=UPI0038BDA807